MTALIALACLIGGLTLGLFSELTFVWELAFGRPAAWVEIAIIAAAAVLGVLVFRHCRRRIPSVTVQAGLPCAVFSAAALFAVYWMFQHAKAFPQGDWDGWAIWNLHARFLYRGSTGAWKDLFGSGMAWSHPDYPLLLPGLVAGSWTILGAEAPLVPALLSSVFGLLSVSLLTSAMLAITKDARGWLTGLILLATPSFLLQSAHQTADIPLAAYILSTIVALQLAERWRDCRRELLFIAGFAAGLAAWTKNEGLLFIVVLVASLCVVHAWKRTWQALASQMVWLAAGLAPSLLVIFAFKLLLAPPNDIMSQAALDGRLISSARYMQIAKAFAEQFVNFGRVGVNPLLIVAAYLLARHWRKQGISQFRFIPIPILAGIGYFAVYLFSPYDLTWHLGTSIDRLFLQLWPGTLFIIVTLPLSSEAMSDGGDDVLPRTRWRNFLIAEAVIVVVMASAVYGHSARSRRMTQAQETAFQSGGQPATVQLPSDGPVVVGHAQVEKTGENSFAILEVIRTSSAAPIDGEAVVAAPALIEDAVLPCRDDEMLRTALSIANPSTATASVTLTFNGAAAKTLLLAPNTSVSNFLKELIANANRGEGVCRLTASSPISVMALLTTSEGKVFRMTAVPVSSTAHAPALTQVAPYFLDSDRSTLALTLTNNTAETLRGEERWYSPTGQLVTTAAYEIAPYAVSWANKTSRDTAGYVQIMPRGGQVAPQAALLLMNAGTARPPWIVDIPAQGTESSGFFVDRSPGIETRLVIVNPGDSMATVRVRDSDDPAADLGAHEMQVLVASRLKIGNSIAALDSSRPVSAVALRYLAATGKLLSAVPNVTAARSRFDFADFALGAGLTTKFVAYNGSGAQFAGRVILFDRSGRPLHLPSNSLSTMMR
jgi:hypothetical protein